MTIILFYVFLKVFRQNACPFQSYSLPLPSLQYQCGTFHMNKGRGYMFKPDQHFLLRLWAYFFLPVTFRIEPGLALCSCGTFHIVWRCKFKKYGGSPSTCFYCPLWWKSIDVVADEEVRAAFFVPLRQTVPGGSRQ